MNLDFMEQRRQEHIFIIAFSIFILKNLFSISDLVNYPDKLDTVMIILFFACIGYKLITQKYSPYSLFLLVIFTLLFAYAAITTQYYSIFYGFLCIVSMQNIKLDKVLRASIVIKTILLLIHTMIYFSVYFLYPDSIELMERNGVSRHFFFLQHPNLFTAILLWTCLEFVYLKYERMKFNTLLVIFLINAFFYLFTNTNTGMIVITLAIVMILMEQKKGKVFQSFLRIAMKFIFPVLASFFIFLVTIYSKLSGGAYTLWHELNNALTGRLLYGAYAYDQFGFTLMGRDLAFPEKTFWNGFWLDQIFFDNGYFYLFLTYGSIYLIIFSIVLYILESKMEAKEKIMIITLAVFGVMEGYILNISLCFPLIIIGKYVYDIKFKSIRRGNQLYEAQD